MKLGNVNTPNNKREGLPEAVARLWATAPELLEAAGLAVEALRGLVAQLPTDERLADYQLDTAEMAEDKLLAAIAMATGQEQPA